MAAFSKAAALCLAAAVLTQLIKRESPVMAQLTALAAAAAVLALGSGALSAAAAELRALAEEARMSPAALGAVLKCLGLAILTRLAADTAKDAGLGALASAAELAGAAAGTLVCLPLMRAVLSMIAGLL